MNTDDDATGTDFWSRRKAAVRQAEEADQRRIEDADVARKLDKLAEKTDAEILEELELPDPDTLTDKDDFSQFLSSAVPERLRRRALRRLWGLNPVLANLDGLVDYAEDYTDAATVISNLQTVYQVGKGMFDRFAVEPEVSEKPSAPVEDDESGDVSSSINAADEQENDAPHNDYSQNEKASIRLTQRDAMGQDDLQRGISYEPDLQEPEDVDVQAVPRRRIRFDYS